jgi:hypothetical protein
VRERENLQTDSRTRYIDREIDSERGTCRVKGDIDRKREGEEKRETYMQRKGRDR